MGRKIEIKKIEDVTKCQVTFSKRRSSMMKKANEIAVCCDVDVLFVAFSPSGRVTKFCNQNRVEEVIRRFVNLSPDEIFNHMSNVQEKMEKLMQLSHIIGDNSKLHYLEKQIENLELQIKKSALELQILETDLRDFEIGPEQELSLHQLSWCERNLNHSLQIVIARKEALVQLEIQSKSKSKPQVASEAPLIPQVAPQAPIIPQVAPQAPLIPQVASEAPLIPQVAPQAPLIPQVSPQAPLIQNVPIINPKPIINQMIMQLDPWISPYSARVRENIFQHMVGQANPPTNKLPNPIVVPNFPIQEPQPPYISQEQPSTNMINMAAPNPNTGAVYEVGSGSQSINSNAIASQVSQEVEQVVTNNTPIYNGNNNTSEINNVVVNGEVYTINVDEVEANVSHAASNQVSESVWAANLANWEAMFLDEHYNLNP